MQVSCISRNDCTSSVLSVRKLLTHSAWICFSNCSFSLSSNRAFRDVSSCGSAEAVSASGNDPAGLPSTGTSLSGTSDGKSCADLSPPPPSGLSSMNSDRYSGDLLFRFRKCSKSDDIMFLNVLSLLNEWYRKWSDRSFKSSRFCTNVIGFVLPFSSSFTRSRPSERRFCDTQSAIVLRPPLTRENSLCMQARSSVLVFCSMYTTPEFSISTIVRMCFLISSSSTTSTMRLSVLSSRYSLARSASSVMRASTRRMYTLALFSARNFCDSSL
uniref:Uncharacterized protein n=1 Tax=Anopheles merus TaxID=30066 RepID=A0A182VBU1_ANOME